jgi:hypothetical protein
VKEDDLNKVGEVRKIKKIADSFLNLNLHTDARRGPAQERRSLDSFQAFLRPVLKITFFVELIPDIKIISQNLLINAMDIYVCY